MNYSKQVDAYISGITDWRGDILAQLREVIHDADPEIIEEWKWGVPIFTHGTMVCAISAFKNHVKINFFKGAQLKDQNSLINAGFESKQHRSIDFRQGDFVQSRKLKSLVKEAVEYAVR